MQLANENLRRDSLSKTKSVGSGERGGAGLFELDWTESGYPHIVLARHVFIDAFLEFFVGFYFSRFCVFFSHELNFAEML